MSKWIFSFLLIFISFFASAQNTLTVKILIQKDSIPIIVASLILSPIKIAAIGNVEGLVVVKNIPDGKFMLNVSALGYQNSTQTINLPLIQKDTLLVYLLPDEEEL